MNAAITPQEIGYIAFFILTLLGMIQFLITQFTKLLEKINEGYEKMRMEAIKERESWLTSLERRDEKLTQSLDQLSSYVRESNDRHRNYDKNNT